MSGDLAYTMSERFEMLVIVPLLVFLNITAAPVLYTLSLHDALPIYTPMARRAAGGKERRRRASGGPPRSEEHTSELQSRQYLVCRLLLEKKKSTSSRAVIRTPKSLTCQKIGSITASPHEVTPINHLE